MQDMQSTNGPPLYVLIIILCGCLLLIAVPSVIVTVLMLNKNHKRLVRIGLQSQSEVLITERSNCEVRTANNLPFEAPPPYTDTAKLIHDSENKVLYAE